MEETSKKILITGGSGFIGSCLANYLCSNKKAQIFILDISKPPDYLSKKINYINLDILDLDKLKNYINFLKPNIVYHFAARTDLKGKSIKDYLANTKGVSNILNCLKDCKSLEKTIFASSMLVCKAGDNPDNFDYYNPPNLYGRSKVIGEKFIKNTNLSSTWCIVRPTSIWGPGFKIPYFNYFDFIFKGKYFHTGKQNIRKTYGYIGNICFQLERLIEQDDLHIHKKCFYLGDSSNYNIKNWSNNIAELSGSKKIKTLPKNLVFIISLFGSILNIFKINFPLTLFRYKNMNTNNIINLDPIIKLSSSVPFDRETATKKTIKWMRNKNKFNNYMMFIKLIKRD